MLLKLIPKKWGGSPVHSFATLVSRGGDDPLYVGVAWLQAEPDTFTVVRLGSDSIDNDVWRAIKEPHTGLSWVAAQSMFQMYLQGGDR